MMPPRVQSLSQVERVCVQYFAPSSNRKECVVMDVHLVQLPAASCRHVLLSEARRRRETKRRV